MTGSKLGWHFQTIPGWAQSVPNSNYVKIIDPPSTNPFPDIRTIGRTYIPDGEANNLIMLGASGAEEWMTKVQSTYQRAPWVHAWEGPNEPPVETQAQRAALVAFTRHWVQLMHARNLRTVALCLSVGWPNIGQAPDLAGALDETDYWAVHEYAAPDMRNRESWLCLRYRRTVNELRTAGSRIPPLLVTECGIDGGVIQQPKHGWKTYASPADYMTQLAWYDSELRKDDYVAGAVIFTSGPNADWQDFDVDRNLSAMLCQYIENVPEVKPEPPPPPEIEMIRIEPHLLQPIAGQVKVTQKFGEHAQDYSKFGLIGHNGLDLSAPGQPQILAAHPGQCWVYDDPTGYGLTVELWYPSIGSSATFKTIYAHLSKQIAQHEQLVSPGDALGIMGSTGNSTGPHLHFGLKLLRGVNPGYRDWIDPVPFMA